MRDAYEGEHAVKARSYPSLPFKDVAWGGACYLAATSGMIADGIAGNADRGSLAYEAYKMRAVFPHYVSDAVEKAVGVMHSKKGTIDLPDVMKPLLEKATLDGEDLHDLLRRINEAQLVTGRIGLLADFTDQATRENVLPWIATYEAESIINWDSGQRDNSMLQSLNLVILDESGEERQEDFNWKQVQQHRVLVLGDPLVNEPPGTKGATYQQALFRETTNFDPAALMEPNIRGRKLDEIPFVFINATDLLPKPAVKPPLLKLADVCFTIYRGSADHRLGLFMQAQDTLVIIGADEKTEVRVGAGAHLNLPLGSDAKFIGVNSAGLPEQRTTLENDVSEAKEIGGRLLDAVSRSKESGEALHVRVAASTATLTQIALTGAAGLQMVLRKIAKWIGADPNKVVVTPNLDFDDDILTANEYLAIQNAINAGLPLSKKSVHARLRKDEWTVEEFEEEMKLRDAEKEQAMKEQQAAAKAMGQGNGPGDNKQQGAA